MRRQRIEKITGAVRKKIVNMHSKANASHIGSSLSCADILVCLYFHVLRLGNKGQPVAARDRFLMSKGHAASALYATLAERNLIDAKTLENYCCEKGRLPGHITRGCTPCIEASAGSLGHGLPIGTGLALAAKYDKLKHRIFVLMSDGECDEGSVWEAALFASHHRLDNLIAIIDYNKLQAFGRVDDVLGLEPLADKWKSFGWAVKEVDGHNCPRIIGILNKVPFNRGRPSVLIAHTIKGKGVSFMEDQLKWHYKSPQGDDLKRALKELSR
jgi:transketolase